MGLLERIKDAGLGLIDVLKFGNQQVYESSVKTGTLNFTSETIRYADEMIAAFSDIKTKGENMFHYLSNRNIVENGMGELDYFKKQVSELIDFIDQNNEEFQKQLMDQGGKQKADYSLAGYTPVTAAKMKALYENMEQLIDGFEKSIEVLQKGNQSDSHVFILRQLQDKVNIAKAEMDSILVTDYSKTTDSISYNSMGPAGRKLFSMESGCYAAAFRDMSKALSGAMGYVHAVDLEAHPEKATEVISAIEGITEYNEYKINDYSDKAYKNVLLEKTVLYREALERLEEENQIFLTAKTINEEISRQNAQLKADMEAMLADGAYRHCEIPIPAPPAEVKKTIVVLYNPEAENTGKPAYMTFSLDPSRCMIPQTVQTFDDKAQMEAYTTLPIDLMDGYAANANSMLQYTLKTMEDGVPMMMPPAFEEPTIQDTKHIAYFTAMHELRVELEGGNDLEGVYHKGIMQRTDSTMEVMKEHKDAYDTIISELQATAASLSNTTPPSTFAEFNLKLEKDGDYMAAATLNTGERILITFDESLKIDEVYMQTPKEIPPEKNPLKNIFYKLTGKEQETMERLTVDFPKEGDMRDEMTKVFDSERGITEGYYQLAGSTHTRNILENCSAIVKAENEFERNHTERNEL